MLTPLSAAADRRRGQPTREQFFHMMKSMTADGYYTSQIGLVQELGYKGNTALPSFPACTHPEHQSFPPRSATRHRVSPSPRPRVRDAQHRSAQSADV